MSSLAAMPVQRRPIVGPNFGAPPIAPMPTATGTFQAPDPTQMAQDPYYQNRVNETIRGSQRTAASRGTLLSGGFQVALGRRLGELASAEGDKIYGRTANTYELNRGTNQQNYGQSLAGYGAQRNAYQDASNVANQQADVINANASSEDLFAQQMAQYRAALEAQAAEDARRQNEATSAMQRRPLGPSLGYRPSMPELR